MEALTTRQTQHSKASLIGLAIVLLALSGSHSVGRTLTSRQFYQVRYTAELTHGLDGGTRNVLKGFGTGGQSPAFTQYGVLGASCTSANLDVAKTDGRSNFPTVSMRGIRES